MAQTIQRRTCNIIDGWFEIAMKEIVLKLIDKGLVEALIGLFGVFVGWFLSWITQKGRLRLIADNGINAKFTNVNEILVNRREDVKCFSYNIKLDVYNGSNSTKIMRDIQISFENKGKIIKTSIPYDNAKTIREGVPIHTNVGVVNIPPKSIIHLDLRNYFWNSEIDFIWDVTVVKLSYKNHKGCCKSVTIEKVDFKNFDFSSMQQE